MQSPRMGAEGSGFLEQSFPNLDIQIYTKALQAQHASVPHLLHSVEHASQLLLISYPLAGEQTERTHYVLVHCPKLG